MKEDLKEWVKAITKFIYMPPLVILYAFFWTIPQTVNCNTAHRKYHREVHEQQKPKRLIPYFFDTYDHYCSKCKRKWLEIYLSHI